MMEFGPRIDNKGRYSGVFSIPLASNIESDGEEIAFWFIGVKNPQLFRVTKTPKDDT